MKMIILKSPREIEKMRDSNRIVAGILLALKERVKAGITTIELELLTKKLLKKEKAKPAFKGYRPPKANKEYPYCLCVSINEEVVHGLPSKRELKEGDILSIDFGVLYDGYYGDAAITIPIGEVSQEAKRLLMVAQQCLDLAIRKVDIGYRVSDISHAIQTNTESHGFSVVREFVGHGIGRNLHEDPQVPNFGLPNRGARLKVGMVLAIEPMVNAGVSEVKILKDGWTAVTADGSLSAHFEHSVALTQNGPLILSKLEE